MPPIPRPAHTSRRARGPRLRWTGSSRMIETTHSPDDAELRNTIANALNAHRKDQGVHVRVPVSSAFVLQVKQTRYRSEKYRAAKPRGNGVLVFLMSPCRYGLGTNKVYRATPRETSMGWAISVVHPRKGCELPEFSLVRKRLDTAMHAVIRRTILRSLFPTEIVLWCFLLMRKTISAARTMTDFLGQSE